MYRWQGNPLFQVGLGTSEGGDSVRRNRRRSCALQQGSVGHFSAPHRCDCGTVYRWAGYVLYVLYSSVMVPVHGTVWEHSFAKKKKKKVPRAWQPSARQDSNAADEATDGLLKIPQTGFSGMTYRNMSFVVLLVKFARYGSVAALRILGWLDRRRYMSYVQTEAARYRYVPDLLCQRLNVVAISRSLT